MFCRTEDGSESSLERKSPFAARTDNMEHYNSKGEIVRPKLCPKAVTRTGTISENNAKRARDGGGEGEVRLKSRILDLRDEVQEGGKEGREGSGLLQPAHDRGKAASATRPSQPTRHWCRRSRSWRTPADTSMAMLQPCGPPWTASYCCCTDQ